MDRQQDVIRRITAHVVAYRFQLENERNSRMAIEIKGLKADALTARANLDKLRTAYAKFNEAAPAHAADVEGLAITIGGMQSDLEFAATVMGNSDGASGVSQKPPVVRQNIQAGVGDLNQPMAAPESIVAQQPATTDRVALGPHPDQPEVVAALLHNAHKIVDGPPEVIDEDAHPALKMEAGTVPSQTFRAAE